MTKKEMVLEIIKETEMKLSCQTNKERFDKRVDEIVKRKSKEQLSMFLDYLSKHNQECDKKFVSQLLLS